MDQKKMQEMLAEAQSYQQQMQVMASQKEALNQQLVEMGKALEELSRESKEEVYKITGPVLIKVDRAKAKKDIESKKELVMLRLKSIDKSEISLKEKLEDIKENLTKAGG